MLDALAADGPHPDHADKLMLFGRFVGSWAVDGVQIAKDGSHTTHRGEWHFGWVLEGRAIQDVLISPPRGEPGPTYEYGTTLRFYDPALDAWRITYVTPLGRAVHQLMARAVGDEIVLEGRDAASGQLLRWVFSGITSESLTWRGFVSEDEGATWRQDEEMHLRRR